MSLVMLFRLFSKNVQTAIREKILLQFFKYFSVKYKLSHHNPQNESYFTRIVRFDYIIIRHTAKEKVSSVGVEHCFAAVPLCSPVTKRFSIHLCSSFPIRSQNINYFTYFRQVKVARFRIADGDDIACEVFEKICKSVPQRFAF